MDGEAAPADRLDLRPTLTEPGISLGVYALGAVIRTVLLKVPVTIRQRQPEAAWAEEEKPARVPVAAAGD